MSAEIDPTPQTQPARILVIDDEPAALRLLAAMLTHARYEVLSCASPSEGLRRLDDAPADCIITDSIMPEMSGLEVVREVRARPGLAATPILMLTRKRTREDVAEAIAAGVTDYVLKPVDEQLLLDKVELCLKKGGGRQFVFRHHLHDSAARAQLRLAATVASLSESDLVLAAPFPFTPQMPANFESRVFEEIGIRSPQLKFVSAREILPEATAKPGTDQAAYESTFAFVGMPEEDLRRIRGWLRAREIQRRK